MDDKRETLEILKNMRDKKVVEHSKGEGLCHLFEDESEELDFYRKSYGVYVLRAERRLQNAFEQTAQAVLGYEVGQHSFWLLPLDEKGNYTLPTYTCLEGEDGEITSTPMYDPVTGQTCSEIFITEPERLTSARLKLLDDMIAYLEKELR